MKGVIPEKLTKRICVAILGEVFDILGRTTSISCGMKLDVRELHLRKLDWDDKIPDDLRKIWVSDFELINEIGKVTFQRAVVPSLEIETLTLLMSAEILYAVQSMLDLIKRWQVFLSTYFCAI